MMATTLRHLDQLLHTVERGRALNVDNEGRLPVRLYGPDGQPLFTEQNPAHVKGEVTLTGQNISDGTPVTKLSFEVDPDGYPVLRVVDAAPFSFDPETGRMKVRAIVEGQYTEKITLFNNVEIRDATERWSQTLNLSKYKHGTLEAVNGLDQTVRITIGTEAGVASRYWNGENWVAPFFDIPPGNRTFFLNSHPIVREIFSGPLSEFVRIGIACTTPPTSGSFRLVYTGVLL